MENARFDSEAIRYHYEAGYTRSECQRKFGFSNGAWNRAVERGDIVPRPRSSGVRASEKRERIRELREQGLSYSEIGKALGLTKPTVAYHVRRLGVPADEKASRRYDWQAVQDAYDTGLSVRECAARFGFCLASWTWQFGAGRSSRDRSRCLWKTCLSSAVHRRAVDTSRSG